MSIRRKKSRNGEGKPEIGNKEKSTSKTREIRKNVDANRNNRGTRKEKERKT